MEKKVLYKLTRGNPHFISLPGREIKEKQATRHLSSFRLLDSRPLLARFVVLFVHNENRKQGNSNSIPKNKIKYGEKTYSRK